jgi:aminomethyltransferase
VRTPLYDRHVAAGAQVVEFGGWSMPLQYTSMRVEHQAVRERVGLFDVSHMGEFRLRGPRAQEVVDRVVSNRVDDLATGQARYNILCAEDGGVIDDALVYRHGEEEFVVVVNAGPRPDDLRHFTDVAAGDCPVEDLTMDIALVAVQGPRALEVLRPLASIDLDAVAYYHFADGRLGDLEAGFSRTGYTGEDGFELFLRSDDAVAAWDMLLEHGAAAGVQPCGLGARDTLRLEAAMRLSGQDIDRSTNPLEAGLGWAVKLDKGDFVGRDALRAIKESGLRRRFVGLELDGRAIARHGYRILDAGNPVGEVTSGTFSFTLGRAVAMGYVDAASFDSESLAVEVRGETVPARRVALPFYKRPQTQEAKS